MLKSFRTNIQRLINKLCSGVQSPSEPACTDEIQQYNAEFRRVLVELEKQLHTTEEPATIAMEALKAVCAFHEADWAGILIADRTTEMWAPAMWYDPQLGEMAPTDFYDEEYFEHFPQWAASLNTGKPIIILDTSIDVGTTEKERREYKRLQTHSVIGAPFGERPTGFLVVRNPRRYPHIPDLVQMLAFVTLSSYYLQELQEGLQLMHDSAEKSETPPDTAKVTINLFGVPEIITPTGQINEEIYHSENGWKLLTYLAIHKLPTPSRSIAMALWPDEDQDLKSDNIRHIIYRFKSKLTFLQPNELIVNTATGYALNPELVIKCDVHEFERLCAQANKETDLSERLSLLKKAVSLYRGDIYAKYAQEHWLMAEAAHYQMLYLKASSKLMELLAEKRDYPGVQEIALQATRVMPGHINACYWMTVSLYRLGGKDAALNILESIRSSLTEEEFKQLKDRLTEEIRIL